jgi:hypothetical protein
MLWRTDYAPGRVNSVALENIGEGGQALLTPGERNWIGRITGLALMVRGPLRQPLVIESIHVEPIDAHQVLRDRARDWFHFAPWNGLSINSAIGGPDEQAVWLPVTVALIALTAIALCIGWQRWRAKPAYPLLPLTIGAIVLVAWGALDARWLWARAQQTQVTAASFAGKSARDKHLADADGEVYAFAEQVRAKLPVSPARVYVTADDQFLRARLAYDLYPHNVYVNHGSGELPLRANVKTGEYIAVFLRHGVEYDSAQQLLRWDGQPAVHAELLLANRGSALFKIL